MICTERLFLHDFSINDLESLHRLNSNDEVMQFLGKKETIQETKETLEKILVYNEKNPGLGYAVCMEQDSNEFIGWFCLSHFNESKKIEINYRLLPEFWNKGYAMEMGDALLRYGFYVLELNQVVGIAHHKNKDKRLVWENLGLQFIDFIVYENKKLAYFEGAKNSILN